MASGLCAAVLGFASSFLVLRGSDLTRLMVTLGIDLILREIANQIPELTGGADGLQGVNVGPILGLFQFDIFGHVGYALLGQKKHADAEPLLLAGYEGMKEREAKMTALDKVRLAEALERLVVLYEATGDKDKAAAWRAQWEAATAASNP